MDEMCAAADTTGDGSMSLVEYIAEMDTRCKRNAKSKREAKAEKEGTSAEETTMSKDEVGNVVTFTAADIDFDGEIDAVELEYVSLEEDFEGSVADVFEEESSAVKLTIAATLLMMFLLHVH